MITENLLSEKYRFCLGKLSCSFTPSQESAKESVLEQIQNKDVYVTLSACPYCGGGDFTKISEIDYRGLPSDIAICDICDGSFKFRILDEKTNTHYYQNFSYVLRGKRQLNKSMERLFLDRVGLFAYPRYYFIRHFIKLIPGSDIVMEIGCNDGANLIPWKKNGFDVLGVEIDFNLAEFASQQGIEVLKGDFANINLNGKRPKLIILSHLLEHVRDINAVLKKLRQIMAPDGYLFIEVPGIRSQGLFMPLNYFDFEHNYNFDLNSMNILLGKFLFRNVYSDEYIRIICTPAQDKVFKDHVSVSLNKIRAMCINQILRLMNFNKIKLSDLLRRGANKSVLIRIFNKLQIMYFKYYYLSIIKSERCR